MYSYSYNQYYQQYQNYYAQWGYDQNTGSYSYSYPQYGYTQSTMQVTMVRQTWSSRVCRPPGIGKGGSLDFRKYGKEAATEFLLLKIRPPRGAWVAQSGERPTSAQVMISRFVSSSPTLGSVLTARSLEPASDSVSPHSAPPHLCSVSLCLKNK